MPPSPTCPAGADFIARIDRFRLPAEALAVWHVNQFGYCFKAHRDPADPAAGTVTFWIDPYLSDDLVDATRGKPDQHTKLFEPPVRGSDVTNADYVFCTHDHLDHLDPTAVRLISEASPRARFVVPLHARPTMRELGIAEGRIDFVTAGRDEPGQFELGPFRLTAFAGRHEAYDEDPELGFAYLGYHLHVGGFDVYHAGDTTVFEELTTQVAALPVDLAFLPINGRGYQKHRDGIMGNMDFKEAAEFAVEIGADIAFPGHWGMHPENTERPGHFVDCLTEKHRYQKLRVMVPGDRVIYMRD